MEVNINQLVPGCILTKDVYKKTNTPIMRKKTVLTSEHIDILKTFLVRNVQVDNKLVNGKVFSPKQMEKQKTITYENEKDKSHNSFIEQFLRAVQQYKKLFVNWQGGAKVNPYKIRNIVLPLMHTNPTKKELINLHHYGTKQDYIYYHAVAVSVLSAGVGKKMKLSRGEIIQLGMAGLLLDAGMSKIPISIFNKKGPLSVEEYGEIKKHPLLGYKLLEDVPGFSKGVLVGILQHHEREDGSGYPIGLKGDSIHLFSKIIAICDIYHAMTSERQYRTKQSPYLVMESLYKEHFGKIDHVLLNYFMNMMLDLSIGRQVVLNSGDVGEIVYIDNNELTRPIVQIEKDKLIKLTNHPDTYIRDVIYEQK